MRSTQIDNNENMKLKQAGNLPNYGMCCLFVHASFCLANNMMPLQCALATPTSLFTPLSAHFLVLVLILYGPEFQIQQDENQAWRITFVILLLHL